MTKPFKSGVNVLKLFKYFKEYYLIKRNSLFDTDYYYSNYPDVKEANINPLMHFIKVGWQEGRNPSNYFDTKYYLDRNKDVKELGVNPLIHYLKIGGFEGRNPSSRFESTWYLDAYPDVRQSRTNPLVHFIKNGILEDRLATAPIDEWELPAEIIMAFPEKTLTISNLIEKITEGRLTETMVISLSQDDYLVAAGGIQVFIASEQQSMNSRLIDYLHIFPKIGMRILITKDTPVLLGLNLNGKYLGMVDESTLINAIGMINKLKLVDVFIHHTMGFRSEFIDSILSLNGHRGKFWLHDYFTLCPSYNLLRNGIEYCGAPDVNSNACTICKYGEQRKKQRKEFFELFSKIELQFIAPSNFTMDFWRHKFPYQGIHYEVVPLVNLNWMEPIQEKHYGGRMHIGFLGYPLKYKGWKTWMKVVDACNKDERFVFYHFSSVAGTTGNYSRVHTEASSEKGTTMTDKLRQYDVEAVLLWSTVPETFSLTLHEALAAGCFIITNTMSGNIQDYLRRNPARGVVLETEDDLLDFIKTGKLAQSVQEYQKDGKLYAEFKWNRGTK